MECQIVAGGEDSSRQAHKSRGPEAIFTDKPAGESLAARPGAPQLGRRLYTKPADIEAFGWTRGCPRCDHERKYGAGRTSKPHSELCHCRIVSASIKTAEGKARVDSANERIDGSLAGQIERRDNREGTSQGRRGNIIIMCLVTLPHLLVLSPSCHCSRLLLKPLNLCRLFVLSRPLRAMSPMPQPRDPTTSTITARWASTLSLARAQKRNLEPTLDLKTRA